MLTTVKIVCWNYHREMGGEGEVRLADVEVNGESTASVWAGSVRTLLIVRVRSLRIDLDKKHIW